MKIYSGKATVFARIDKAVKRAEQKIARAKTRKPTAVELARAYRQQVLKKL